MTTWAVFTWSWMAFVTFRIYQHEGYAPHFKTSRKRYCAIALLIFITWPIALALYEERLAQWCQWSPYGKK